MQVMTRHAALLVALTLLTAACSSSPEADPGIASPVPADNAAGAALLPGSVDEIPEMDLETFEMLRAQVEGTPLVVNVWASWCDPCEREAPDLASAAARYGDRVQFLGVDVQDHRGDAQGFVHEYGWPYPSVFDPSGEIMAYLGITGPPATLFYAADGSLVQRVPGLITHEVLDRGVRDLLR